MKKEDIVDFSLNVLKRIMLFLLLITMFIAVFALIPILYMFFWIVVSWYNKLLNFWE